MFSMTWKYLYSADFLAVWNREQEYVLILDLIIKHIEAEYVQLLKCPIYNILGKLFLM